MKSVEFRFVEFIPAEVAPGIIYISMEFGTATHRCCCGCGNEVITPFSPTDWKLTFDGETISLFPSIGNWGFPCRSHYWIKKNQIWWAESWSDEKVSENQKEDLLLKKDYFSEGADDENEITVKPTENLWNRIKKKLHL